MQASAFYSAYKHCFVLLYSVDNLSILLEEIRSSKREVVNGNSFIYERMVDEL